MAAIASPSSVTDFGTASSLPLPTTPPNATSISRPESAASSFSDADDFNMSFVYLPDGKGGFKRVSVTRRGSSPPTPEDAQKAQDSVASSSRPQTPDYSSPSASPPLRRQSLARSESMPGTVAIERVPSTTPAPRSFQRTVSGPVLSSLPPPTSLSSARTPSSSYASSIRREMLSGRSKRISLEEQAPAASAMRSARAGPRNSSDQANLRLQTEAIREEKESADSDSGNDREWLVEAGLRRRGASPPHSATAPSASSEAHLYAYSGAPLGASSSRFSATSVAPVQRPPIAGRQIAPVPSRASRTGGSLQQQQKIPQISDAPDSDGSPPPVRTLPAPPTRSLPSSAIDEYPAGLDALRELDGRRTASALNSRYRRSASFSNSPSPEPPRVLSSHLSYGQDAQRPGSSLGLASNRNSRTAIEERYRNQIEHAPSEYGQPGFDEYERKSPSPDRARTSDEVAPNRHRRRNSETVRVLEGDAGAARAPPSSDPQHPGSIPHHLSPSSAAATSQRHRRSPTAPEGPTGSAHLAPSEPAAPAGRTWASSEGHRPAPPPPAGSAPARVQVFSQPSYSQADVVKRPDKNIIVNGKAYARLDMIGKGGSSRVYRVLTSQNEMFAIKRVGLDKNDPDTMAGYMNEISLLKRLDGNNRIIRLIDSEVQNNKGRQNFLYLVMECGEIDLARLLAEQMSRPLNLVWVGYYWQQMLEAVHVIHEEKIVHSDLKPANFVLVRGQLKLIDFGIANAIASDTTNIQRDHQVGTINYMSPEAIELPDGMRRLKLGRPSDVWSLGCILYQMVYGRTPFAHLTKPMQKMKAIPDPTYKIEFPEHTAPMDRADPTASPARKLDHLKRKVRQDVVMSMNLCLKRVPKDRATIPELLEQEWLGLTDTPTIKPRQQIKELLQDDETVINPYFMRQLLEYGLALGAKNPEGLSQEKLIEESRRLVGELKALDD